MKTFKVIKKQLRMIINRLPEKMRNPKIFWSIAAIISLLSVWLAYGLINYSVHRDKAFNNTYVAGMNVGGQNTDTIIGLTNQQLLITIVGLEYKDMQKRVPADRLGLSINQKDLKAQIENKSFWSAFRPWFVSDTKDLPITLNEAELGKQLSIFKDKDFKKASSASFTYQKNKLVINGEKSGVGLNTDKIGQELVSRLSDEMADIYLELTKEKITPTVTKQDIESLSDEINHAASRNYTLVARNNKVKASKKQIADWLSVEIINNQPELKVNNSKVAQYVKKVAQKYAVSPVNQVTSVYKSGQAAKVTTKGQNGLNPANIDDIAELLAAAASEPKDFNHQINYSEVPFKKVKQQVDDTIAATYTYDVAVWGNVGASLSEFKAQVAQTLADSRGWRGGGVSFQEVSSGGSFTIVLSSPDRVASAAPICSAEWSCRAGRYVIINDERWRGATSAWNSAGGSLRDYRHMVVNHEVGHWLGLGHSYCSGAGQLAPVMQQQSINLQGCKFNPWPKSSEQALI